MENTGGLHSGHYDILLAMIVAVKIDEAAWAVTFVLPIIPARDCAAVGRSQCINMSNPTTIHLESGRISPRAHLGEQCPE